MGVQSRGKQKAEVLSQPYWCWSLICMCYQPISLGRHTHTHTHTHTHAGVHIHEPAHTFTLYAESPTHTVTQTDHIFPLNTDAYLFFSPSIYSPPPTFTRTPFPLSSLPYAPDGLQICRSYRKSPPIQLLWGERR